MCRLSQMQVCRMYIEQILSAGNMDFLEMVIARGFVGHNPIEPEGAQGRDGVRQRLLRSKQAFPNGRFEIQEMIEEGDRVTVHYSFTGSPAWPLADITQTNQLITGQGIEICRLREGQIVEAWSHGDYPGMPQAIGATKAHSSTNE